MRKNKLETRLWKLKLGGKFKSIQTRKEETG
jgi:hypothetical protein